MSNIPDDQWKRRPGELFPERLPQRSGAGPDEPPSAIGRPLYTVPPPASTSDLAALLQAFDILLSRKWHIILPATCGLIIAVLVGYIQIPRYRADAALEVQGIRESFGDAGGASAPVHMLQNQAARLLKSKTLIDRARNRVLAQSESKPEQRSLFGLAPLPTATPEQAIDTAAGTLNAVSAADHMIVDLNCESPRPEMAAAFLNALIDEYVAWNREQRWNSYQHTSEWLVNAQNALREKLERSEMKLRDYAQQNNLLRTTDASSEQTPNIAAQRLSDLQQELSRAEADRIMKEAQLRSAEGSTLESLSQMPGLGASSAQYNAQLTDLRRQLADLSSSLTPAHYKVQRVQAQIVQLEATLRAESQSIVERLRKDHDAALHRERTLRAEYLKQTGRVSSETDKLNQYNILKQEVAINRQLYEATLKKGEEASIESALRSTNSRIVDRALIPDSPTKPNRLLYCGVGLLGGVLLGAAFVLGREWTDRTIRAPGDAMASLDIRELGAIPTTSFDERMRLATPTSTKVLQIEDGESHPHLPVEFAALARKESIVAESFRSALIAIGKWSGRTLMVTSAGPREGKTAVTANLAITIAESGSKVLVIDADMRRPRLHKILWINNDKGLATLLSGEADLDKARELICQTKVSNLSLMPAGQISGGKVSGLLHSVRLYQLVLMLRREFDVILIDTPPLLPVSDARIIGRLVDGALLVLRAKQTTREAASTALSRLREDRTPVLGALLNDWNPKTAGYGAYGKAYAKAYESAYYSSTNE